MILFGPNMISAVGKTHAVIEILADIGFIRVRVIQGNVLTVEHFPENPFFSFNPHLPEPIQADEFEMHFVADIFKLSS